MHDVMRYVPCMHTDLEDSARGPTGDLDISSELDSICTSVSKLFDSFLSKPASLPAGGEPKM